MRTVRSREAKGQPLFAGERAIAFYSWDWAWCDCAPTLEVSGVPCISVAVSDAWNRCLGCGECWYQRRGRREERAAGVAA